MVCCKNFVVAGIQLNFYGETFTIDFFSSFWVLFHQFKLDIKPLHIKIEVIKETFVYMFIIATRIFGCNYWDQIMKVKDTQLL